LEIIFNLILQFFLSPIFLLLFSYLGWFIKLIFFLWFNAPSFFSIGFDPFFFYNFFRLIFLSSNIKLVWNWVFWLSPCMRIYGLQFWKINLGLEDSFNFA
jgi:hypothetical protein